MDSSAGDRGVSEVVGFILVFGMLVIAFTVYQGIVVPDQNRQVEFQHNQEVHGQLQDLRNAIVTTAATGSGQAVSVTLGASYPRRAIAQNLGVSGGSLQTTDVGPGEIRIANARAVDGEAADYLDGSVRSFETSSIRYTPVYTFYSSAPQTVYENSLLFNRFGEANVTLTDQVLVDGRRITLVALNGTLSRAQRDTVSVSTEAISASSTRVAVRNTTGERLNLTVPTRLSATKWAEVLAGEMGSDGYVEGVYDVPGEEAVNVSLQQGVTYELRMAEVGVGDLTVEEPPAYATAVEGDGTSIAEGGTQKLVVEVRDRFNNPVSNVTVDATVTLSAGGSDGVSPASETTDSDGRATFTYSAPSDVSGSQPADVTVTFGDGGDATETVTFDVEVLDSDGSGGGGGGGGGTGGNINPGTGSVILVDTQADTKDGNVTLSLRNSGSQTRTLDQGRLAFYNPSNNNNDPPSYGDMNGNASDRLTSGDPYEPVDSVTINPGQTVDVVVSFEDSRDIKESDFFILSIVYEDGETADYFVSVP